MITYFLSKTKLDFLLGVLGNYEVQLPFKHSVDSIFQDGFLVFENIQKVSFKKELFLNGKNILKICLADVHFLLTHRRFPDV